MKYCKQSIDEALDADNQKGKLHRDIMTIEDMEESEFGPAPYTQEENEQFYAMHQKDNQ